MSAQPSPLGPPGTPCDREKWQLALMLSPLPLEHRFIGLVISTKARRDGDHALMSVPMLCERTQMPARTLSRRVRELLNAGWLALRQRGHGVPSGHRRPSANVYRLTLPADPTLGLAESQSARNALSVAESEAATTCEPMAAGVAARPWERMADGGVPASATTSVAASTDRASGQIREASGQTHAASIGLSVVSNETTTDRPDRLSDEQHAAAQGAGAPAAAAQTLDKRDAVDTVKLCQLCGVRPASVDYACSDCTAEWDTRLDAPRVAPVPWAQ